MTSAEPLSPILRFFSSLLFVPIQRNEASSLLSSCLESYVDMMVYDQSRRGRPFHPMPITNTISTTTNTYLQSKSSLPCTAFGFASASDSSFGGSPRHHSRSDLSDACFGGPPTRKERPTHTDGLRQTHSAVHTQTDTHGKTKRGTDRYTSTYIDIRVHSQTHSAKNCTRTNSPHVHERRRNARNKLSHSLRLEKGLRQTRFPFLPPSVRFVYARLSDTILQNT